MNFWTRLLIVVATALPAFTSAFAQEDTTGETASTSVGTLEIVDEGTFNATLCGTPNFGPIGVTSSEGGSSITTVTICYEDNGREKDAYVVLLSSTDFFSNTEGVDATIPATSVRVHTTYSPVRAAVEGCVIAPFEPGVGLIYATAGEGKLAPVVSPATVSAHIWGDNNLASPVTVGSVDAGGGTALCQGSSEGMRADIDLELTVPAAQMPADYASTLTLEVDPIVSP